MRKAVSITLGADNLLWLRAQAAATPSGTVSGVLDRLVSEARQGGRAAPEAIRSVVGTGPIGSSSGLPSSALMMLDLPELNGPISTIR